MTTSKAEGLVVRILIATVFVQSLGFSIDYVANNKIEELHSELVELNEYQRELRSGLEV